MALRELNDRLELRILERTEELEDSQQRAQKEIRERQLAEAALRAEHVYLNLLRSTELVIHEAASIEGALNAGSRANLPPFGSAGWLLFDAGCVQAGATHFALVCRSQTGSASPPCNLRLSAPLPTAVTRPALALVGP